MSFFSGYGMKPITVLLSIYGNSPFLTDFLKSLQKQSLQEFQVLCRADGEFVIPDELYTLVPGSMALEDNEHRGVVGSYGRLIHEAPESSYYMFADQDDIWHSDKIEKTLSAMKNAEEKWGREMPILVHSDLRVVTEELQKISDSLIRYQSLDAGKADLKDLLIQNNVTGCTVMINKALFDLISVPPEAICHDWYVALTAAAFGKIVFIDSPLVEYRQHSANVYGAVPRKNFVKKLFSSESLKQRLTLTQVQAEAFARQYHDKLSQQQIDMLDAWGSNLKEPFYLKRLFRAWRWGFKKHDWLRSLGMWWAL